MGNTANSRPNQLHSKSIPNMRSLSDESEKFYFAQALKLQEQFLVEKNLLYRKHHIYQNSSSLINDELQLLGQHRCNNNIDTQFCCQNYRYSLNNPAILHHQHHHHYNQQYCFNQNTFQYKPEKLSATKKLNKFFGKLASDKHDMHAYMSGPSVREGSSMGDVGDMNNQRPSVGTRLSCMESGAGIKPMYSGVNVPCVLAGEKCLLEADGDLNKSIDLEETTAKFKKFSTEKRSSMLNNSNNSSSSGCSSGASSSNLSTGRRAAKPRPESSLSNWSTNKLSTPSPPPPQQPPVLRSFSSIRPATSQKSIMSAISRELVQKSSTPMEENSGAGKFSYANRATGMFQPNRSFCKKKKGERNLVKSDSTNSFSSMVVMKPGMMLQSSISSAGVSSSCGFVSSEISSITNSKTENQTNPANTHEAASSVQKSAAKRGQNRFNKAKSESMYVRAHHQSLIGPGPSANSEEDLNSVNARTDIFKKSKSTKSAARSKKHRDSGILTDLFHLNGSVSSLRNKLTSATHSLRKSLSTFNLRGLSIKKSRKLKVADSAGNSKEAESDLDTDMNNMRLNNGEFVNSEDNFNSPSEDDDNYEGDDGEYGAGKQGADVIKSLSESTSFNNSTPLTSSTSHAAAIASTINISAQANFSPNLKPSSPQSAFTPISITTDNTEPSKSSAHIKKSLNTFDSTSFTETQQNIHRPSLIKIIKPASMPINYTRTQSSSAMDLQTNSTKIAESANQPPLAQHKKIVVQASTTDLLNCFAQFIGQRCHHLAHDTYINPLCYMNSNMGKRVRFEPKETISWLRSADCALLIQGWQEIAFINPVNVVFVYLLVRDTLKTPESVSSVYELQCNIMACLYLAFSYMGNEISYPLKPFLIEENRTVFWERTCGLMANLSANMLRINRDQRYFTELFYELKSYSLMKKSVTMQQVMASPGLGNCRNSSCIENYDPAQEPVEEVKHIRIDLAPRQVGQIRVYNGNRSFSSQKNLESFSNASLGGYDRKRTSFKNRSKSFYHGFEKKGPCHQVVFASSEPVSYCI